MAMMMMEGHSRGRRRRRREDLFSMIIMIMTIAMIIAVRVMVWMGLFVCRRSCYAVAYVIRRERGGGAGTLGGDIDGGRWPMAGDVTITVIRFRIWHTLALADGGCGGGSFSALVMVVQRLIVVAMVSMPEDV